MEIIGDSLDEILMSSYAALLEHGDVNKGTRGDTRELIGVIMRIRHPRARLSRSLDRGLPFSALGEFMWYLTRSDDPHFITAYIPAYKKEIGSSFRINGAYGPRIFTKFGLNQINAISNLLLEKPGSRRAVIQIYAAADLLTKDEVPCTTTLQFFVRNEQLHLSAHLRSNDAYKGLPHDVFCFTMIQEMVARRLGLEIGEYIQMVGSFHLYETDIEKIERYQNEGHQRLREMQPMPLGDPFDLFTKIIKIESDIRSRKDVDAELDGLHMFWADLLRLAQVHFNSDDNAKLDQIKTKFHDSSYEVFLEDRRGRKPPTLPTFQHFNMDH